MPVYEWPVDWYRASQSMFYLASRSQVAERPWIGGRSVYGPHAQFWVCKMTIETQVWDQRGQAMSAFFSRLDGQAGLLRISDQKRLQPQWNRVTDPDLQAFSDGTFFSDGSGFQNGLIANTGRIAAAAKAGASTVVLGGLLASRTRMVRRGDLFQIKPGGTATEQPHLYEIQGDGNSSAAGTAGVEIRPRLRTDVGNNTPVSFSYPSTVFRLLDDEQGQVQVEGYLKASLGFTLIEAII